MVSPNRGKKNASSTKKCYTFTEGNLKESKPPIPLPLKHFNLTKRGIKMIFDAHLHLPCREDCLTFGDKRQRLLNDLTVAGVDGGIVIADSELLSVIGTTEECIDLFAGSENIFVMAGISPLINYKARLCALDKLLSARKAVALKLYPGHEAYYMDDARLTSAFALCEKYDVPLVVHTGGNAPQSQYSHPHYLACIAGDHPSMRIVICHLCWPNIDLCYETTAAYPNIYYDISSLAHEAGLLEKTIASLRRIAETHANRMIFGSYYGACSIEDHIHLVRSLGVNKREERMILADNALALYKLCLPL